jgi:superfamily II DNA or RNA helicase/HKD family nuclease
MSLPAGVYDLLITSGLAQRLTGSPARTQALGPDGALYIIETLARQLADALDQLREPDEQVELANALIEALRSRLAASSGALQRLPADSIALPPRLLRAVALDGRFAEPPEAGLSLPWLFTAAKGSPALLHEIRSELGSANEVDVLVSFITVSGVRKLRDVLQQITAVDAAGLPVTRIRILTTTYTGATEMRALDELARLPGCEVRVSLDGRRTRLHAKAWIFRRLTGFGSAYVGSANLSGAALTGGLEWTVKIAQRSQDALFARAIAHFETLWSDNEFQPYDPDNPEHREALGQALGREAGDASVVVPGFFDLQPKTYQQDMLDQLAAERSQGRWRNLVVAATGTGKTVVAAFDYRETCRIQGGRPRLLFVAHREEILKQALRTYREVLRDPEFGELFTGAHEPSRFDHLFATINVLSARDTVSGLGGEYWHTVVIDECHRMAAESFDRFARSVRPKLLLGLTATPERTDGQPIARYFDSRPDGSPAVEMRLWHALDLQLLAPFEYYAVDDATDFSGIPWDRPGEREAIDVLVTGNDIRARLAINEWRRLASDARLSRALVFCVSVAHAEFMTDRLNQSGLPAACIVGTTPHDERRRAPQRLQEGELCALVTVDLFNEGIDLPTVDTLLLLRPTQSPVLFQQQIGRGLRLAPGKEGCLVLDFVGQHRADFRFDRLLSGLTGLSRRELDHAVEHGFGSLPPGCHLHLQRQTREQVLANLRALTQQNWRRLTQELQQFASLRGRGKLRLVDFLHEQSVELSDVYRDTKPSGWTSLLRESGLLVEEPGPEERYFSQRFVGLTHLDDARRISVLKAIGSGRGEVDQLAPEDVLPVQMLAYQVDGVSNQLGDHHAFIARLSRNPVARAELGELSDVLQSRSVLPPRLIPGLEDTPLSLHASYQIREVLTAVGWLTPTRRAPFQAGVLPMPDRKTELLFVTLDKSEGYHDRIAYRDYAINAELFHWQSQNAAGPDTMAGRRYVESATNGWRFQLFVRERKDKPYRACGPVVLERWEGDRPMSIVWRLAVPLSARMFSEFSVLRMA